MCARLLGLALLLQTLRGLGVRACNYPAHAFVFAWCAPPFAAAAGICVGIASVALVMQPLTCPVLMFLLSNLHLLQCKLPLRRQVQPRRLHKH